jgi:hypothetical protein
MKTTILILFIFFACVLQTWSQTMGPFNYGTYVKYDGKVTGIAGQQISYSNIYSRADHNSYDQVPMLDMFYYSSDRVNKTIKKPFVFVEGISFDKETPSGNKYTLKEYFDENGYVTSETSQSGIILLGNAYSSFVGSDHEVGNSTFNWATLVSGIDAEGIGLNDPLKVEKAPQLLNNLICAGYDIILIDFISGQQYIENNGEALFTALSEIKQMMVANGSTEKMAVCGASMGGLVARYALRKHELAGHTDWFSHFISFDSPQKGANINLGLQYTLKHLMTIPLLGNEPIEAYKKVTCPSASQLVRYTSLSTGIDPTVLVTTPGPSLERTTMLLNPNLLTWPTSCRLVSISNGSRNGTVQYGTQNIGNMPLFNSNGVIDIDINTLPNTQSTPKRIVDINIANACQWLNTFNYFGLLSKKVYVTNALPLDGLSGSYRKDIDDLASQIPRWLDLSGVLSIQGCNFINMNDWMHSSTIPSNVCFIPTLSSAGIINFEDAVNSPYNVLHTLFQGREKFEDPQHNVSHFDVVYAPVDNQTHVEITDENIEWVMTELIAKKDIAFQNEVIPNGTYQARETIKAGRDVDKYGDNCMQPFQAEMSPQYSNTAGLIQTCGPVSPQSGSVVVLHAGSRIELHPGFTTGNVAYFEASVMGALGCGAQSGIRYAAEGYEPNQDSQQLLAGLQTMAATETKPMLAGREGVLFVLQPNPTRGEVLLKSNLNEEKWIEVRDVQGRLLQKLNSTQSEIPLNLSDLPAGLYYISSTGEQHRFVSKVLKE